jgi:hypothetical protein
MFPKAPLVIPDGRLSRVRLATSALPWQSSQHGQGARARPHPPCTPWFPPRLVAERPLATLLRLSVRWWSLSPTAMTESPCASPPACPGGRRSYGRRRQTSSLCAARGVLLSPVWAGGCEPLRHRGPSRRSRCASFLACLAPSPGGSCGAWARCFPHDNGLPPVRNGSALHERPSSDFRRDAPIGAAVMRACAGSHVCSPPRSLLPIRPTSYGSRGVSVRASRGLFPPHAPDMLTVRIEPLTV